MMNKRILKVLYLLSILSFFLPWFTYNARMMGYCWGFQFIKWFILPTAVITIYLFSKKELMISVLAEISSIANIILMIIAFGMWQQECNIITGFHFTDGFRTALPTFYIALILFLIFFIFLQYTLIQERADNNPSRQR